jgi:hypothetical protein
LLQVTLKRNEAVGTPGEIAAQPPGLLPVFFIFTQS